MTGSWLDANALSEQDFLADLPVVLSASRLVQPKYEAPAAITVIDRELIEASTALDITDLLRLVPGFQVGQVSGSERSITSHGMADQLGRRMQVLVDGRSVYDPVFGGALWQSMPVTLADVERIEVVRGPNAAAYGANAFLGAINIVTRSPGARPQGRANLTIGGHGTRQADITEDWVKGPHRLQLRVGLQQDDGFVSRHDGSESTRLNLRYKTQLSRRDDLDIELGIRDATVQTGFPDDPIQPERDTKLRHHYQQLRWQRLMDDGSDLSLQLYHNYQSNQDDYPLEGYPLLPNTFLDRGFITERYDAELQWRLSPSPATRLVLGGGWRLDKGEAPHAITPDADRERLQFRLFAHGEYRLTDNWLLQGGAMAERFEGVGSYLSPRVSLNHTFLPRQALRLSVARGYRIPALFEQDAYFGAFSIADGSPAYISYATPERLKAESITAYEIGLVGDLRILHTQYDIKLFRHIMDDLIDTVRIDDADPTNPLWNFRNGGKMDLRGVEAQLDLHPTSRTRVHAAWSLVDPSGEKVAVDTGGILTYQDLNRRIPRQTLALLVHQRFSAGWAGSASWTYVAPMAWGGEGDNQDQISRVDLKLGRSLRLFGSTVRLEMLVQNLFNQGYYDFYIPQTYRAGNLFDRRIYGQVVVSH